MNYDATTIIGITEAVKDTRKPSLDLKLLFRIQTIIIVLKIDVNLHRM